MTIDTDRKDNYSKNTGRNDAGRRNTGIGW